MTEDLFYKRGYTHRWPESWRNDRRWCRRKERMMSLWLKSQSLDWHEYSHWPAVSPSLFHPSSWKLFYSQHHYSFRLRHFLSCVASKIFTRLLLPLHRYNTISFKFLFPPVELPLNYLPALFSKTSRSLWGEVLLICLCNTAYYTKPFHSTSLDAGARFVWTI